MEGLTYGMPAGTAHRWAIEECVSEATVLSIRRFAAPVERHSPTIPCRKPYRALSAWASALFSDQ